MPDPRQQAEAVARWCYGTKRVHVDEYGSVRVFEGTAKRFSFKTHGIEYDWFYYSSLDVLRREVEDEIERRGLMRKYEAALTDIFLAQEPPVDWHYFLIRATAAQRLEAAAKVIEEVQS